MTRILVIDDNQLVRETLTRALSDAGYDIISAENGEIGLKQLKTEPFDLVVTDLVMPDGTG